MSEEVERVRRLCLELPEATERLSHGESAWFAKKQFVMFADHHHDRVGIWAAAPENAQSRWLDTAPDRFFVPPYVGVRGWIGVYLDLPLTGHAGGSLRRSGRDRRGRLPPRRTCPARATARCGHGRLTSMRAVLAPEPGGPEALAVLDRPTPVAAAGEVLIEVAAAGINRADLAQREGHYPPPNGASDVLGLEVSGRIAALGDGVETLAVGDEVCALLAGGGYAEFVAVAAGQVLAKPSAVSLVDAAGLPETTCTVWSNVVGVGRLTAGEWLLVHGGSSGIGTTAIQIGKALGAHVAVTAGSASKLARCRELGADVTIDYRTQDFVEVVRAASAGRGADVVLDIVGAAYLERNVEVLAADGRIVVIGMQKGRHAELDLGVLMAKRGSVAATGLRARPTGQKVAIVDQVRTQVWPMVETGAVRPIVDRTFPIEQVADAHRLMESSTHIGKILLTF